MLKISRESEINLINLLIDQDIISGKDLANIKKASSEGEKSQIDAVFELNLTDEETILNLLVKEQSLAVVDLTNIEVSDEIKTVLPSNYINMNFIAPFKIEGNVLHIAISDSSKLSLMRNLKTITKKDIELHAAKVSQISDFIEKLLKEGGSETTIASIKQANEEKEEMEDQQTIDRDIACSFLASNEVTWYGSYAAIVFCFFSTILCLTTTFKLTGKKLCGFTLLLCGLIIMAYSGHHYYHILEISSNLEAMALSDSNELNVSPGVTFFFNAGAGLSSFIMSIFVFRSPTDDDDW